MAYIKPKQIELLEALGRPPIKLPAEVNFGGNVLLQKLLCNSDKCPPPVIGRTLQESRNMCRCGRGIHHLPQFQQTGTYFHPELVKQRLREAQDSVTRCKEGKMSDAERKKLASQGIDTSLEGLIMAAEKLQTEWMEHVGKKMVRDSGFDIDFETMKLKPMEEVQPEKVRNVSFSVENSSRMADTKLDAVVTGTFTPVAPAAAPLAKKAGRPKKVKTEEESGFVPPAAQF